MNSQRLILPINDTKATASYKTAAYLARFLSVHYGVDLVSRSFNRVLYASGNGEVVAVGQDSVVGNVVAVRYPNAYNRITGRSQDVVFRYFHLYSALVRVGQKVTKDTRLGTYGSTGMLSMSPHLHLEADTDIAHPLYSPTVKSSNFIKGRKAGANDKTMSNPLEWLHCKTSSPDNQSFSGDNNAFVRASDRSITKVV